MHSHTQLVGDDAAHCSGLCQVQERSTAADSRVQHGALTLPDHGDDGGGADEVDQAAEERLVAQVAVVLLGMLSLHDEHDHSDPECAPATSGIVSRLLHFYDYLLRFEATHGTVLICTLHLMLSMHLAPPCREQRAHRDLRHLQGHQAEALLLKALDHLADDAPLNAVRLDLQEFRMAVG